MNEKTAKKSFIIFSLVLVLAIFMSLWPQYASSKSVQNYKGDEVWYVDAARNFLYHDHITVHYTATETWYEGDVEHKDVFEGVNVFVRLPQSGTPYNPQWYSWSNFDKYVYNAIVQNGITGVRAENYQNIIYGRYYLVPVNEYSKFVQAVENITAPEDITTTYEVNENGQTVTKTFTLFKKGEKIFDVRPGFMYADHYGIESYYNLEHPFLGKIFIIASMYLFGDKPTSWRIPSLIMYYIVLFAVGLSVVNITKRYFWGAVAMLLVAIDPGLRMLGVTGMLDIYVAAFTALTAYSLSKKDLAAASIFAGLAAAVKFNGIFVFLGIMLYIAFKVIDEDTKKDKIFLWFKETVKYGLITTGAFLVANVPIFAFLSPREWWLGFIESFKWHLSYKGYQPFTSPIWNWFFNKNPFTIYFNPRIMIQTNWFLWDLAVIFGILGLFVITREDIRDKFLMQVLGGFSIVFMYFVMYALGGVSQYSYYSVQITPFFIIIFTTAMAYFLDWKKFLKAFKDTIFERDVKNAIPDGINPEE